MPIPNKAEIQAFEARLDRELARRMTNRSDANAALRMACNMVEVAATKHPEAGGERLLNDGIETFATYLVSGATGDEPTLESLMNDLEFGYHYHHLRELLYYSYNAPGSIDWTFAENRIELRLLDRSVPRQFFTVWNEHVLGSQRVFDGFEAPDKLKELLKDQPEFELSDAHEAADSLLQAHADLKLAAYFSILDKDSQIDLGGYTYGEIHALYRVLLMKALYHRYQASVNDHLGCIHVDADELRDMLAEETNIDVSKVEAMLQDLVFDSKAAAERVDPSYFSLMREGAAPHRIIVRPCHFSKAEGLVQLLRVVAQRRPKVFLSNVSNVLGAAFVQRVKTAFEAQGFSCLSDISLRAIDPTLPDIDLLVIVEEPTLGFVMLVCEVKSPLPPRWAKDQLRALHKDNVSKAFRQTEAISAFLQKPEGIEFIRSVVPKGGLEHFDSFITVLQQLIVTSDNAGMFFEHEDTPIINFRTLERLLLRSDGDVLHMRYCISHYNEWADECATTALVTVEVDGCTVQSEGFTPTRLLEFPQAVWKSGSERQQMIDDFVANGHHPFDCLLDREGITVAPPKRRISGDPS